MHRDDRIEALIGEDGVRGSEGVRVGREVLTAEPRRSAVATTPGPTSSSGRLSPSITTWSGMTVIPARAAAAAASDDVESVTTAMPAMATG